MESIISYFGTYKPAADGAVASFKFEYLCTLGFAAIVIFLGRAIVARSETLRKYAIPAPVISGLIFSIIVSCIKGAGIVGISFDATIMKDLCQNLFFLCVGFGFSAKMLRHAGGKLCALIAFAACLLITCQDLLGYALSQLIGMHPLLALQCSSAAMSGGVGTASAFGPIFEEWGAADATVVGVAAGTMGNIMGSLIGGPVAAFLIAKHGLKADPNDKPEAHATGKVPELDNTRMIMMFALCLLLAALGMPIYCLLDNIPMIEMPKFIGCLFAGAIARNVMEAAGIKFYVPEVEAIEHMFLELLPCTRSHDHRLYKACSACRSDGNRSRCTGYLHGTLWNLCILQSLRPRLRRSCHDSRKHRLGLRFRFQCRRKRESDHGPVRLAHHRMGFVSVLCRYHRRYLQPDLPFYLRRLIPFIEIHVTFTKGHLTSLFSPGGIPHFPPGFCPFFSK